MAKIVLTLDVDGKKTKEMYNAIVHDLFEKGRADIKITQKGEKLIFKISSEDFTSVRASINAILLKLRMFSELDQKLAKNEKDI
ncbi:MAG: hypothetical protein COT14_01220 [Candidatus Diapherotrites archaeon CG08_land_8_20_14_0_20_30_16]|nr:MAG: hypothetical protein COT14_01220 [Candidatus Diapherotrites archaeon CG08_land_8_20_14_0_20_30_16]